MPRLTDEDLEQLLRETFADKEKLIDSLPQATKRRRRAGPALMAAATVLVVLGGILYGVNRTGDTDPTPPVATTGVVNASGKASPDADVWAAVILAVAQQSRATRQVYVFSGTTAVQVDENAESGAAARFSAADKVRIEQLVAAVAPVRWKSPVDSSCTPQTLVISLGAVSDRGDHKQVSVLVENCGSVAVGTYRVDRKDGVWTATPVGVSCPVSRMTPASPQRGC